MHALFSRRMKALHIRPHIRTVYQRSEQGEQIDREAHPQGVGRAAYQQVLPHITAAVSSRYPTANEIEDMTSISNQSHISNPERMAHTTKLYSICDQGLMNSTGVRSCVQLGWGIINGFTYLHEQKVAHLEIKPNNLVCDDHFRLQIIDFNVRE